MRIPTCLVWLPRLIVTSAGPLTISTSRHPFRMVRYQVKSVQIQKSNDERPHNGYNITSVSSASQTLSPSVFETRDGRTRAKEYNIFIMSKMCRALFDRSGVHFGRYNESFSHDVCRRQFIIVIRFPRDVQKTQRLLAGRATLHVVNPRQRDVILYARNGPHFCFARKPASGTIALAVVFLTRLCGHITAFRRARRLDTFLADTVARRPHY